MPSFGDVSRADELALAVPRDDMLCLLHCSADEGKAEATGQWVSKSVQKRGGNGTENNGDSVNTGAFSLVRWFGRALTVQI